MIRWQDAAGQAGRTLARAVVDATGTWGTPNPIGLDGLPVPGEAVNADRIAYGIPDVNGTEQDVYAGRHILVIGAGHSAINAVLDLLALQSRDPSTRITWAARCGGIARLEGGGLNDALPGRGQLGLRATEAIASGRLTLLSPCAIERIARSGEGLMVAGRQGTAELAVTVDRIIVATGYRPDLGPFRELRLALDPVVEAPTFLAPLIDPNLHSCGTVPPHGVVELTHPERDFYIVGMKSYGRAPTFLMLTGYEQVRSVIAELGRPLRLRTDGVSVLRVTSALGFVQILAGGSTYYLLAILSGPIMADTGWSGTMVTGGISRGLLVAGLAAARTGRVIHRYGGRHVMAAAMGLLAGGLALMAVSPSLPVYLAAWAVLGLGMGAGLYDAAFSSLGQVYGAGARRAITQLTLWCSATIKMRVARQSG